MALALYIAVSTGQWDAETNPTPAEKRCEAPAQKSGPFENIVPYPMVALYRPSHPQRPTALGSLVNKN
jgi:hypothetical protein